MEILDDLRLQVQLKVRRIHFCIAVDYGWVATTGISLAGFRHIWVRKLVIRSSGIACPPMVKLFFSTAPSDNISRGSLTI
jgi:hypothetical protein